MLPSISSLLRNLLPVILVLQGVLVLEAQSPSLRVEDVSVYPGQSGVTTPIYGLSSDPVSGFQIAVSVDPDRIFSVASTLKVES